MQIKRKLLVFCQRKNEADEVGEQLLCDLPQRTLNRGQEQAGVQRTPEFKSPPLISCFMRFSKQYDERG